MTTDTQKMVDDLIKAQSAQLDQILHNAFLNHFGFRVDDADKDKLAQYFVDGLDGVMGISYCGETFLFLEWPAKFEIQHTGDEYSVTVNIKYKDV